MRSAVFERTDSVGSEDRRNHLLLARDLEASKSQVNVLFGGGTTTTSSITAAVANGDHHHHHRRLPSSVSSRGSHPDSSVSDGNTSPNSRGAAAMAGATSPMRQQIGGGCYDDGGGSSVLPLLPCGGGRGMLHFTQPQHPGAGGGSTLTTTTTTTTTTMTSSDLANNTYHAPGHYYLPNTPPGSGGAMPRTHSSNSVGATAATVGHHSGGIHGVHHPTHQDPTLLGGGPLLVGGGGYDSTGGESSDGDAWMEQYRKERLDDIMRRNMNSVSTPRTEEDSQSNFNSSMGGLGASVSSMVISSPGAGFGSSPPAGSRDNLSSFPSSSSTITTPSTAPTPGTTTTGGGHLSGEVGSLGYRRRSSSVNSHWGHGGQQNHRMPLTKGELDLCKRVDLELKRLLAGGGTSTVTSGGHWGGYDDWGNSQQTHLTQLDKRTIIRVVQCKKTFDRSVEMCKLVGSAIIDRFGLGHLTQEDVEPVLSRQAIARIDPNLCVSRDDGSSFLYLVLNRLAFPSFPTSDALVQTLLFVIEKNRAFEGRLTIVLDATLFEVTPGNAKTITQLAQSVFNTLIGKYPARVSKLVLLNPKGFGSMTQILIKGMLVKALSSKWRERVVTVKSLDRYIQNQTLLRRELFQKLNW